jgi:hypothetical protein
LRALLVLVGQKRVREIPTNNAVASQTDYSIFNRFRLTAAALAGKRLKVCAYAYFIPAYQSRRVYATDFVHNNYAD